MQKSGNLWLKILYTLSLFDFVLSHFISLNTKKGSWNNTIYMVYRTSVAGKVLLWKSPSNNAKYLYKIYTDLYSILLTRSNRYMGAKSDSLHNPAESLPWSTKIYM